MLVVGADHCIALPVTHLLAAFNVRRAIAQWPADEDLHPAIPAADVPPFLLLVAARILRQRAPAGLAPEDILVQHLLAHRQGTRDLLQTPLQLQQCCGLVLHPRRYKRSVAGARSTPLRQLISFVANSLTGFTLYLQ